jgi:predicted transcriptional regulator
MQIEIPPELVPFLEQEFATGQYAKREDVILQALRWLCDERQGAVAGIRKGLDDADAGRCQALAEAFADIRNEFGVS